jgi:hypothetical protein
MRTVFNNPSYSSEPKTPLDIPCRGCAALPGEKCRLVDNRTFVRAQIRAGQVPGVMVRKDLNYFHDMRRRDLRRAQIDFAKLEDWRRRYAHL